MPQFDFAHVFWPQLVWLAIFFVVLYFGVVRLTLPRLGAVMGQREDKIAGDLVVARTAKESADEVSRRYHAELDAAREAARSTIAAAKAGAARDSDAQIAAAAAAAEIQIAQAEARIAAAVAAAQESVRAVAAEGAQAIVTRLTGTTADPAKARAHVDARFAG